MESKLESSSQLPEMAEKIVNLLKEKFENLEFNFLNFVSENTINDSVLQKKIQDSKPLGTIIVAECITPTKSFGKILKDFFIRQTRPSYKRDAWIDDEIKVKQIIICENGHFVNLVVCPRKYLDYVSSNIATFEFCLIKPTSGHGLGIGS